MQATRFPTRHDALQILIHDLRQTILNASLAIHALDKMKDLPDDPIPTANMNNLVCDVIRYHAACDHDFQDLTARVAQLEAFVEDEVCWTLPDHIPEGARVADKTNTPKQGC